MSETYSRILSAAQSLFQVRGYNAVGTQEICRQAGVHKGTLYHFFSTKLDIALAVLERYGADAEADFLEMTGIRYKPARRLSRLFDLEYRCAIQQQQTFGMVTGCLHNSLALELAATEPRARELLEEISRRWAKVLEPTIEELIASGEICDCDKTEAARLVFGLLSGSLIVAKLNNDPEVILRMGHSALRLLGGKALLPRA